MKLMRRFLRFFLGGTRFTRAGDGPFSGHINTVRGQPCRIPALPSLPPCAGSLRRDGHFFFFFFWSLRTRSAYMFSPRAVVFSPRLFFFSIAPVDEIVAPYFFNPPFSFLPLFCDTTLFPPLLADRQFPGVWLGATPSIVEP